MASFASTEAAWTKIRPPWTYPLVLSFALFCAKGDTNSKARLMPETLISASLGKNKLGLSCLNLTRLMLNHNFQLDHYYNTCLVVIHFGRLPFWFGAQLD